MCMACMQVVLTILYSIAGLGIAIVNDFKSIEGDRELGMRQSPTTPLHERIAR